MHAASSSGNTDIVKALLAAGADANVVDKSTLWTPLHYAAAEAAGGCEVTALLLSAGSVIDAVGQDGLSPLDVACFKGNTETVCCLLAAGANMAVCRAPSKWTGLHFACAGGWSGTVEALVRAKAPINAQGHGQGSTVGAGVDVDSPLMLACEVGRSPIVLMLIAAGADIGAVNSDQSTALHTASERGHPEVVRALLAAGASVHVVKRNGWAALHCGCAGGSGEVVVALLKAGADVSATVSVGPHTYCPLYIACVQGHQQLVAPLLAAGSQPDSADNDGKTVLMTACQNGSSIAVDALLKAGASVNTANAAGNTSLIFACFGGVSGIVSALLSAGALVHLRNGDSDALSIAVSRGHKQIIPMLVDAWGGNVSLPLLNSSGLGNTEVINALVAAGVDANCADGEKNSPLHFASKGGHLAAVEALLAAGANVDASNVAGWAPLHYACSNGHHDVCCLLLRAGADANFRTTEGSAGLTPLMLAATQGRDNVVRALLVHPQTSPSQIDLPTVLTVSELITVQYPDWSPQEEYVRAEMETTHAATVDIDAVQATGVGALHFACAGGHVESAKLLITAGVDCNVLDAGGNTPLLFAAENGHHLCVYALLATGADIDATNKERGLTALAAAAMRGHSLAVGVLLASGADTSVCDQLWYTALQLAVSSHGKHDGGIVIDTRVVVGMLLYASTHLPNDEHNRARAMTIAVEANYPEMVDVLQATGATDGRMVLPRYDRQDLSSCGCGSAMFVFGIVMYYLDIATDIQLLLFFYSSGQDEFFYLMLSLLLVGTALKTMYHYNVVGNLQYVLYTFLQLHMLYDFHLSIRDGRETQGYASGRVIEAFLEAFPSALLSAFVLLDQMLRLGTNITEEVSASISVVISLVISVGSLTMLLGKSLVTGTERALQMSFVYKCGIVWPFYAAEVSLRLLSICALFLALGGFAFPVLVAEYGVRYFVVQHSGVLTPYRWLTPLQALVSMVTDCVWLGESDALVRGLSSLTLLQATASLLLLALATPDGAEYSHSRVISIVRLAGVLAALKYCLLLLRVYVGGANDAANQNLKAQTEAQYVSVPVDLEISRDLCQREINGRWPSVWQCVVPHDLRERLAPTP